MQDRGNAKGSLFWQYSKEEFYALNIESYKILQEKEGVDKALRF
ncbi:hypothetical protein [Helicobacter bilis]|nr:hypothetical protein [Helicobacter bilis]